MVNRKKEIQPFFSIIIPVYNMEKYILDTLKSVENQTYVNYEVIIMDDGSTDNTFRLCKDYTKKDSRFRIYQQKNQGPMMARRAGLEKSKGIYCLFLDSDDCYEKKTIKTLYKFIQDNMCDMIIFNSFSCYKRKIIKNKTVIKQNEIWTSQKALLELLKNSSMYSLCLKAVKRTVIEAAGQDFYRNINHLEDYLQSLYYIYFSQNIGMLNEYLYKCRRRSDSLSSEKMSVAIIKDIIKVQEEAENFVFQNINITPKDIFNCHVHFLCEFMGYIYSLNQNNSYLKSKISDLKQLRKFDISRQFLSKEYIRRIAPRNRIRAILFKKRYFCILILLDMGLSFVQSIIFKVRNMEKFEN